MSNSKLINYTIQDFQTEKDMELNDFRWNQIKDKYLPKLKKNGLLRMVSMRIWNKENVFRTGHLFEYKDDISFKKCLPIWQEIDALEQKDTSIKYQSMRGIVTEDILF